MKRKNKFIFFGAKLMKNCFEAKINLIFFCFHASIAIDQRKKCMAAIFNFFS